MMMIGNDPSRQWVIQARNAFVRMCNDGQLDEIAARNLISTCPIIPMHSWLELREKQK